MNLNLVLLGLALCVAVVVAVQWYLRGITRRVLLELCHSDSGAAYWLRVCDVLALAGALVLVLLFVPWEGAAPVAVMRWTLLLTLLGVFVSVAVVASTVWRSVLPEPAALPRGAV